MDGRRRGLSPCRPAGDVAAAKNDFHTVNYGGTEIVIEAARKRGIKRFLHCSTESILFRASPSRPSRTMPPAARRHAGSIYALENARRPARHAGCGIRISGGNWLSHHADRASRPQLTPPTAMLRHFLKRRLQLYLDFVVNLVDVRDVAEGLILAMERGQAGHRYVLGGESIPLKTGSRAHGCDQRPPRPLHSGAGRWPKWPRRCWSSSPIT
jgi:dihydroflavonol-4-reductase